MSGECFCLRKGEREKEKKGRKGEKCNTLILFSTLEHPKKTPSKKDRTLHKLRHFHSLVSENTRTQGDEEE